MDDISFVAAVGASVVVGLILWWAIGRYHQSRLKRALAAAGAVFLGFVVYLILGVAFVVIRPERAHETGVELGHGFKTLSIMLGVVTAIILAVRGRARAN